LQDFVLHLHKIVVKKQGKIEKVEYLIEDGSHSRRGRQKRSHYVKLTE